MLEIIVAFPKEDDGAAIKRILIKAGYDVAAVCTSGTQVMAKIDELDEGIVICGYRLLDISFRELKEDLPQSFQLLLIASSNRLAEISGDNILSLSMPLKPSDLVDTLSVLFYNYQQKKRKLREKPKQRSDDDKRIINKAKGILMERNNMTEEEAHRYIQKNSMDSGTGLVEMAEMIIRMSVE